MTENQYAQTRLPFEANDAERAGRWNDVSLALSKIGTKCDLHLSRFVRLVFDLTRGGSDGTLTKSYRELAQRPAWLCCSERKARSTVEIARRLGFVTVEHERAWSGSQKPNSYTINWPGIHSLLRGGTDGTTCHPLGTRRQGRGTTSHPHGTRRHHTEDKKLTGSTLEEYSGTGTGGPATDPGRRFEIEANEDGGRPRTATVGLAECDTLTSKLVAQSPILLAARGRRIAPSPAGGLAHGVFAPLTGKLIAKPVRFVGWHRQQLSTAVPVMGDTEADLLLTLAAALYAGSMRDGEVEKNRVAVFVHTIARRKFWRVLPHVPAARTLLNDAVERYGKEWAGLADEPACTTTTAAT